MARDGAQWHHEDDELTRNEGFILLREKSAKERCKKRKKSSIRNGIDHYYNFKQQSGSYADNNYDFDDFDDFDEPTYH